MVQQSGRGWRIGETRSVRAAAPPVASGNARRSALPHTYGRWLGEPPPGRRVRLTDAQRRRLAVRGQKLGRRILAQVAGIVHTRADLLISAHRAPRTSPDRAAPALLVGCHDVVRAVPDPVCRDRRHAAALVATTGRPVVTRRRPRAGPRAGATRAAGQPLASDRGARQARADAGHLGRCRAPQRAARPCPHSRSNGAPSSTPYVSGALVLLLG